MELPVSIQTPPTPDTPPNNDSNIQLPKQLESVKVATIIPRFRHRWNTNEEIASILLAFSRLEEWQQHEVKLRPPSGCLLLFNRNSVRYRKDGYCWKKRKDARTIREDHMKLKVQGLECIYGSYVHSAILPTFHRRCYWLLQNPDMVLVHYLNVPYPSNTKLSIPVMSIAMEKKEWTKEELTQQLKPMFSITPGDCQSVLDESIQTLVERLMDNQDRFRADHRKVPIQPDHSKHDLKDTINQTTINQVAINQSALNQSALSQSAINQATINQSALNQATINQSAITNIAGIKTELLGQAPDSQNCVNFAQGVILNFGNLAKGQQVMLFTGHQTNPTQLSILANSNSANSSSGAQLHAAQSEASAAGASSTCAGGNLSSGANINISDTCNYNPPNPRIISMANAAYHPHTSQHVLARSASLCDTNSSYSQMVMQRSLSQDGGGSNLEPPGGDRAGQTGSRVPTPHCDNMLAFASGVHDNQGCYHSNPPINEADSCSFHHQANASMSVNEQPSSQQQHLNNTQNQQQMNSDQTSSGGDTMYKTLYTATNSENENSNSMVNSFLDSLDSELNSELMSTDRSSLVEEESGKRNFGHLGDSFESLQASLPTGTDINLDQLDLMDVPDLEQMCNDLNTASASHSAGAGVNNDLQNNLQNISSLSTENLTSSDQMTPHQTACHNTSKSTHDHGLSSKFDDTCPPIANVSSSSSCNLYHQSNNQGSCSNSGGLHSSIFSRVAAGARGHACSGSHSSSGAHTMSCSNNATCTNNSQASCLKPGAECSPRSSRQGQGHQISQGHLIGQGQGHALLHMHGRGDHLYHGMKAPTDIASITDFSPDWAYTEGQTKVLVTGPWHANMGTYTVLLDGKVTATTLVQNGVLRCFVPGHKAGQITLEVSCEGEVISNKAMFEYRERPTSQEPQAGQVLDWFSLEDCKLLDQLVVKLERIESALSKVPDFPSIKQAVSSISSELELDACMTRHLESLSTRLWTNNDVSMENGTMGLTLLHLVAGLGYNSCTKTLIAWRNENSSWLLEYEVDAHSQDLNSCTPLMWACARGHNSTAVSLFSWNKGCLHSFNREGNLPLLVARQHGHHKLADQLEQLDSSADMSHDLMTSSSSASHEGITETSIYGTQRFENVDEMSHLCSNVNSVSDLSSPPGVNLFSSIDYPDATSTPVTKDTIIGSASDLSNANRQNSDNVNTLGALHIDIPPSTCDHPPEKLPSHKQATKREKHAALHRSSEQMKYTGSSAKSTSGSLTSSSLSTVERRQKLRKRFSVDIISNQTLEPVHFSPSTAFQRPVREANSEPHLAGNVEHLLDCDANPMLSEGREMGSPEMLVQFEQCERHGTLCGHGSDSESQLDNMDTDHLSEASNGSFIDVERVSSDEDESSRKTLAQGGEIDPQPQMVHLAKQIIAAMPERIKSSPSRGDDIQTAEEFQRERSSSYSSIQSSASPHAPSSYGEALSSYGEDSGISTPMHDSLAFDEYRYPDVYSDLGTPASSLSPDSTCLHSPYSPYTFHMDSPPPTAAEFIEYFNAPATFMEKDFSQLTLSDREQRKLYEAAKVIQSAYRQYKDKQCKQQAKEREAAVLIQSYYRRYKQYAYYKKMTQAAVLIQSQFRSYYAQKRFKKSRDAAVVIQNQYRSYKEHERLKKGGNKSVTQRFRSHYQRKPIGTGKNSRVVQIVPDTDGCQEDPTNIAIDEYPADTNSKSGAPSASAPITPATAPATSSSTATNGAGATSTSTSSGMEGDMEEAPQGEKSRNTEATDNSLLQQQET